MRKSLFFLFFAERLTPEQMFVMIGEQWTKAGREKAVAGKRKREKLHMLGLPPEEEEHRRLLRETLGYLLPAPETERAAEALFDAFGGFSGVFAAPEAELARIPGVGEETARFLRLTTDLARACMEDRAAGLKRIYDTDSAAEAFRPQFLGRKTEAVCLMLLDGRGRLLYNRILSEGSLSQVPVYIRRLIQLCIEYDAQDVMLAHNHPGGSAAPSRNDLVATRQVEMALESIDAELRDHIIFAGEDLYSFAKSGMLAVHQLEVRDERRDELNSARRQERELLEPEK